MVMAVVVAREEVGYHRGIVVDTVICCNGGAGVSSGKR